MHLYEKLMREQIVPAVREFRSDPEVPFLPLTLFVLQGEKLLIADLPQMPQGLTIDQEKDVIAMFIRFLANQPDVSAVLCLNESWVATADNPADIAAAQAFIDGGYSVQDIPGRTEAVMGRMEGIAGTATMVWEVKDNQLVGEPRFDFYFEEVEISGRFAGFWPDHRKHSPSWAMEE